MLQLILTKYASAMVKATYVQTMENVTGVQTLVMPEMCGQH